MEGMKKKRSKYSLEQQKKKNKKTIIIVLFVIGGIFLIILLFAIFFRVYLAKVDDFSLYKANVAVIPIEGFISTGDSAGFLGEKFASSKDIVKFIEEVDEDKSIHAIIFEINSPGGSPVASKEIVNAVKRSSKPKYVLIREVGASGAYWIASAVDKVIVANEFSIVGSVGVIGSYLEFSGLFKDYNVTYQRLVAGKYKDIGDPFKPLTFDERELLEKQLRDMHSYFLDDVIENRGLKNKEDIEKIKTGMFFIGAESKKLGLVDELGDKKTLEDIIKRDFDAKTVKYALYKKKVTWADIFSQTMSKMSYYLGRGFGRETFSMSNLHNKIQIIS